MTIIAILGAFASLATLWALIRAALMVRRHREGSRRAGLPAGRHVWNEIAYLGIDVAIFGAAVAVIWWAMG